MNYYWNNKPVSQLTNEELEQGLREIKDKEYRHIYMVAGMKQATDLEPVYERMKLERRLRKVEQGLAQASRGEFSQNSPDVDAKLEWLEDVSDDPDDWVEI
ncbi:MAG: hypothetical protein ABEK59_07615 [Halobacteria archaeon]